MKLIFLIGLTLLCSVNCDLLDEQFFLYILDTFLVPTVKPFDPPALVSIAATTTNSVYDALAPYLNVSIGLCSSIPRRPVSERTQRNKNIAIAYAVYRTVEKLLPDALPQVNAIYLSVNLDVNDMSLDLSTPIGIGNYAAKKVLELRLMNGLNQLGDLNGKKYNRKQYEDYTNYKPKNTAYDLPFPGKWQPNIEQKGYGVFFVQQHIFPQYGRTKSMASNSSDYSSPAPTNSDPFNNFSGYKKQVDEVLKESWQLNDKRKMIAEHFDDKISSLFGPIIYLAQKYGLNQDEIIILDFLTNVALFDAGVVAWREKIKHDAIRPFSAVRYLYGNQQVKAWGGPGVGAVSDIRGKEWRSYIRTAAHTDYPSGSACFCASQFELLKKYFNTNDFGFSVVKPKGSSSIEPNLTPASDVTLGPYQTYDDYVDECAKSRVIGGVHFKSAVEEGKRLCRPIGAAVYNNLIRYVKGTV